MQWLRLRPDTAAELNTVDWRGRWIDADEDYDDAGEPDMEETRVTEEFDPVRDDLLTLYQFLIICSVGSCRGRR